MPNLGPTELLIILAIVVVLFGATRIGDIGKGLGRGIKEFRREIKDESKEDEKTEASVASSTTTDETPKTQ